MPSPLDRHYRVTTAFAGHPLVVPPQRRVHSSPLARVVRRHLKPCTSSSSLVRFLAKSSSRNQLARVTQRPPLLFHPTCQCLLDYSEASRKIVTWVATIAAKVAILNPGEYLPLPFLSKAPILLFTITGSNIIVKPGAWGTCTALSLPFNAWLEKIGSNGRDSNIIQW